MDECEYEVRISDPGEVAAALPFLLGFHPRESVVVIGLGGESGGRIGMTVRIDIPPPQHAVPMAAAVARGIATDAPAGVLVAVVSEDDDVADDDRGSDLPHRDMVHALVVPLADEGIPVRDAFLVRRGRWWSYDCPHPCCDPDVGTPLPDGVTPLQAASVATGQVVARSREELEARIASSAERGGAAMAAAVLQVSTECSVRALEAGPEALVAESWAAVIDAVARHGAPAPVTRLADREVVRVCWGMGDPDIRDRALQLAVSDDAAAAEALWVECVRRVPAPLDAVPAALLAVHAWLRGDGAMANVAVDRALLSDPGYLFAHTLRDGLAACVRPDVLRAVIAGDSRRFDDVPTAG
jgi:hypothetical protein